MLHLIKTVELINVLKNCFKNVAFWGFNSPPFKVIFHAGISGLQSPGIYAWEEVTPFHTSLMKISYIWR